MVDSQLWPSQKKLDYRAWLSNYSNDELEYAIYLLNSFIFINEELVDQMFISTFHKLSAKFANVPFNSSITKNQLLTPWQDFLDSVIVTQVTGEKPSATDSGYIFTRKARQILGICESKIMPSNADAIRFAKSKLGGTNTCSIIFVDDFVGSGNQFIETWEREHSVDAESLSFKSLAAMDVSGMLRFIYCPLICTELGYDNITYECPEVFLQPTHVLSEKYNLLSPDSGAWPDKLKPGVASFIDKVNKRAGIISGPNIYPHGFHGLGLSIAFYHSVPDASLPIFFWERFGWKPLIRRT